VEALPLSSGKPALVCPVLVGYLSHLAPLIDMRKPRALWSAFALVLVPFPFAQPRANDEREATRRLQELEQRFAEERKSWLEFRKQAKTDEERADLVEAFPRDELVDGFTAVVKEAPGGELAARAWLDVLRVGALLDERELYSKALERLVTDHVTSATSASLVLELVYGAPSWSAQPAAAALRTILAENPDKGVQAGVLGELSLLVGLDESFGDAGRAEAETLLRRIETEYGGAGEFIGMNGKDFAAGARHEITHLRVGEIAPDFEVTDQDGVRFKLSDYRGRVVLLDFWGFV
jgi:hypothetical protein